jgi:hypothetical protein
MIFILYKLLMEQEKIITPLMEQSNGLTVTNS